MSVRSSLRAIRTADLRDLGRKAVAEQGYRIRGTTQHSVVFESKDGVHTVAVPRTSSDMRNFVQTKHEFERWAVTAPATNGHKPFVANAEMDLKVIDFVVAANREVSGTEIAEAVGQTHDQINTRMQRLLRDQKVVTTGIRPIPGVKGPGSRFYASLAWQASGEQIAKAINSIPVERPHFAAALGASIRAASAAGVIPGGVAPEEPKRTIKRGLDKALKSIRWEGSKTAVEVAALLNNEWGSESVSSALSRGSRFKGSPLEGAGYDGHGHRKYRWVVAEPEPTPAPPPPDPEDTFVPPFTEADNQVSRALPNLLGFPPSFWEDLFQGLAYAFARLQA